jgi:hypothetical protein
LSAVVRADKELEDAVPLSAELPEVQDFVDFNVGLCAEDTHTSVFIPTDTCTDGGVPATIPSRTFALTAAELHEDLAYPSAARIAELERYNFLTENHDKIFNRFYKNR